VKIPRKEGFTMPLTTPGGPSGAPLPGGIRHQLVLWLNQVSVLQPLLEQLQVRQVVSTALQAIHGEELSVVESGRLVEVLILNRLMAPRPLYRVSEWLQGSVLAHRLCLDAAQVNDARLGRLLDALDGVSATIWPQLLARALPLGGTQLAALYYDITSFYFEGAYEKAPQITYGYSRDRRPDTQQLEVGLSGTAPDGLPLAYRVLGGNTADVTTPVDNLHLLQTTLAQVAPEQPFPLIISDRAMLSLATLAAYEAAGGRYLGPLPDSIVTSALLERAASTDWAAHPLAYRPARDQRRRHDPPTRRAAAGTPETETPETETPETEEGVYYGVRLSVDLPLPAVGTTPARTLTRTALVVKSTRKATLDATHRQTLLTRLQARLSDLAGKLNRGRYRRWAAVEARLATVLAAPGTARVRRFLTVHLSGTDGQVQLQVERDAAALAHAATRDGLYALLTNDERLDNEAMLAGTKGRDRIEKRIGIFKGPLAVRPMFLEKIERIRAMVFICLVALLVYSLLEQRARHAGLPLTARKVLERFAVCSAVLTTFADGTTVLLAAPFSAWQQELAAPLAVPDPNHWLIPLDPLPS
jgi:transposase